MTLTRLLRSNLFTGMMIFLLASAAQADEIQFSSPKKLDIPDMEKLEGVEIVDYDGDGIQDLLSGLYSGHLLFRKNTGTNGSPKYAKAVKLTLDGEETIKLKHW